MRKLLNRIFGKSTEAKIVEPIIVKQQYSYIKAERIARELNVGILPFQNNGVITQKAS